MREAQVNTGMCPKLDWSQQVIITAKEKEEGTVISWILQNSNSFRNKEQFIFQGEVKEVREREREAG